METFYNIKRFLKENIKYIFFYYCVLFLSLNFNFLLVHIIFSTFGLIIFYVIWLSEYKKNLLQYNNLEALLTNRSMTLITENVHHELNTPIEVITNKIHKIKHLINNKDLNSDFEFIEISLEQISTVLDKMKNFKSLKYSNGNKTLYDIIDGGFKILSISNPDFFYYINLDLKKYQIKNHKLKNVDFLNILINHFKNSLEANASEIVVDYRLETKLIKILIKDDGNGIDKNIQKNLFKPNTSSKGKNRGNGMFINKLIIRQTGGDIKIVSTSKKGTIIEISIPYKPFKKI